ncbi:MAG: threonylcarbamoyl-AMP synthase [Chloroflexi bacterium 54-19]|nr:MAG: threonylcarbamoyl-AMP synthase [Chloroflexi bacterium 54-19]
MYIKTLLTDRPEEAAKLLRAGQTVIFPTETVYGLGGDATNPDAVAAIYAAKQRPADNPLIVHIWHPAQVDELAHDIPGYARQLIAEFFPGPFSLLLPKRPLIPDITTAGSSKVCLRMPSLELSREFLRLADRPVAAPSANLSGRPSPTRWQDCLEDMDGRVGAILKGPEAVFGLESTIVDASGPVPVLLRPGAVTLEMLRRVVPGIATDPNLVAETTPGMKYRHYAPKAKVSLVEPGEVLPWVPAQAGYIGLTAPAFAVEYQLRMENLEEYGQKLFSFFRECDRRGLSAIFAERVEPTGLGRAIMNRLRKAAGETS